MTVELEEKLAKETERVLEHANNLSPETDLYLELMEEIRKNCEILNKVDQIGYEEARANDDRVLQRELKERELDAKKKDRWKDIGVGIAQAVIPAAIGGAVYLICFSQGIQFEEHGAITSTLLRALTSKLRV